MATARGRIEIRQYGVFALSGLYVRKDGFDPQELEAKPGQVLNVTLLRGAKKP